MPEGNLYEIILDGEYWNYALVSITPIWGGKPPEAGAESLSESAVKKNKDKISIAYSKPICYYTF